MCSDGCNAHTWVENGAIFSKMFVPKISVVALQAVSGKVNTFICMKSSTHPGHGMVSTIASSKVASRTCWLM